MKCTIYSTLNANSEEGRKRCIFDEVLEDFMHIYNFKYLVGFFEEQAKKYYNLSIDEDERFYSEMEDGSDDDNIIDTSKQDNFFTVSQIVWVVKTLELFYERGYDFKVTNISTEKDGWIMNFELDISNLTKEQFEIIYSNAFEQNQLKPSSIVG